MPWCFMAGDYSPAVFTNVSKRLLRPLKRSCAMVGRLKTAAKKSVQSRIIATTQTYVKKWLKGETGSNFSLHEMPWQPKGPPRPQAELVLVSLSAGAGAGTQPQQQLHEPLPQPQASSHLPTVSASVLIPNPCDLEERPVWDAPRGRQGCHADASEPGLLSLLTVRRCTHSWISQILGAENSFLHTCA